MSNITIYTRNGCGFCTRAKALLSSKNVDFIEKNASQDPDFRAEMIERSKRTTFPQIFIGETHVGGCDDLHDLERERRLDPLLESVGA